MATHARLENIRHTSCGCKRNLTLLGGVGGRAVALEIGTGPETRSQQEEVIEVGRTPTSMARSEKMAIDASEIL